MNITFRQIEIFNSVAKLQKYTRAAEQLHMSQPAVSMQIRQLEDSVGLPLFEQIGKKIHLTGAGKQMHSYACWLISPRIIRESPSASISPTARRCSGSWRTTNLTW
jgi:hypothetical protein